MALMQRTAQQTRQCSVSGARVAVPAPLRASRAPGRRVTVRVASYLKQWPEPQYIEEVKAEFPEKGVATIEETRVLFSSAGYTWLDVRPALEYEDAGKVRGSVNVPYYNAKWVYNPETRSKSVEKAQNPDFVQQVKKRFPKKDTPLLVGCSDGRTYTMDALIALDEEGYTNLVGVRGGYYGWFRVFDNKLNRRNLGEYQENYTHDGDSCGIHSSGAGFDRVDKADKWVPPKY